MRVSALRLIEHQRERAGGRENLHAAKRAIVKGTESGPVAGRQHVGARLGEPEQGSERVLGALRGAEQHVRVEEDAHLPPCLAPAFDQTIDLGFEFRRNAVLALELLDALVGIQLDRIHTRRPQDHRAVIRRLGETCPFLPSLTMSMTASGFRISGFYPFRERSEPADRGAGE